jgi:hypothetical protein
MNWLIAALNPIIVAALLAAAMLGAWTAGRWMGRRLRQQGGEMKPSKLDDASLAMLGLLLAFAFGMAISKNDQRQTMVSVDSNAIGDFYRTAMMLKAPQRAPLLALVRDYTQLRLDLAVGRIDASQFDSVVDRTQRMQMQMTDLVAAAVGDGAPIADSLVATLNGVIDANATRIAAFRDRLPSTILLLLVVTSIVTALLLGREEEIVGTPEMAGTLCIILVVCLTIYVTLDLNQPQQGLIRVTQEPLERLLATMPK